MGQSFCDILGAKLLRDDRLFHAALVSFGSFGIIHAVVLRAEPLYILEQHVIPRHFSDVMDALPDLEHIHNHLYLTDVHGKVPANPPYHFEIVLNPFAFQIRPHSITEWPGVRGAYIRYMYKHDSLDLQKISPTGKLIAFKQKTTATSNEGFTILQRMDELVPFFANTFIAAEIGKLVIEGFQLPDDPDTRLGTVLTPGGTFPSTGLAGRGLSCELGLPPNAIHKAIDIILHVFRSYPLASMPSLRFVGASQALLAPTFFKPYTCMIEFPASLSDRTLDYYRHLWTSLEETGVPFTYHWGQCQRWGATPTLGRRRLETVFGHRADDWLAARNQFLDPRGRDITFSGELIQDCGLSPRA
jgi:hypothetical protein